MPDDYVSPAMPDDYDRELSRLDRANGVTRTKPTQLRVIPILGVGGSSSYSVTTMREQPPQTADDERQTRPTFTVFLEIGHRERLTRVVLPDAVLSVILRQRDALASQAARRAAKQAAETRKARGFVPTFGKRPRKS